MNESDKNVKRKYSFSDYNPSWIKQFERIRAFVLGIFGDKAFQIEHVGSTAIPGMKAKPLIDVLIIVKNIKDVSEEIKQMGASGYGCLENYLAPNTLLFFKNDAEGERFENIHVCEIDSPKVKQFLVMRDFLRAFPEKAKAYSDIKESNFQKHPDDYIAYRTAKAAFLEQIQKEAYEWKENK